jgi:hypothetical protein
MMAARSLTLAVPCLEYTPHGTATVRERAV